MPINRKKIVVFFVIVFILFLLPFLVREAQKRQLFGKRAQAPGYSDEVASQLPQADLEFEDGILAPKIEIDKYLTDKKSIKPVVGDEIIKPKGVNENSAGGQGVQSEGVQSATGGTGGGESSRLTLPSISAFSSSLQTGVSNVSYPIATFPGLGGLTPSVSLSYSSSSVDDMKLYQRVPGNYNTQAGIAGLGWDLGGVSYIARDTTTNPDSFQLVFAGGGTRLFKAEGSNDWQSNPKLFVKVHHTPNNHYAYYDTNTWTITTQDGTTYIFGSPVKDDGSPLDEGMTPLTLAKAHPGDCETNGNTTKGTPNKWYLREVRDVNGNGIVYEYDKDWAETYYGACEHRGFTTATYLSKIKYNFKNSDYQTTVDFNYEGRGDYQTFDWIRYHRERCKQSSIWSADDCDKTAGMVQFKSASKRLKEISVNVTGKQARKYVLSYEQSAGRGVFGQGPNPSEWHPGHSLLKEIKQFGTGNESLPPYTFTYSQTGDPNNIYLTRANNGYGGEVNYEYTSVNPSFCTSEAICGGNGDYGSAKTVVSKITTNDGEGNSIQKSYIYQNPKAYVKTQIDTGAVDYCNQVWRPQCVSSCEEAYPDNPDALGRCKSRCENAFCGYAAPFTGFEFYGFGTVTENLSALNNPGTIEASSRTSFFQSLEKPGCFEPDPRRGRVYKAEVLNPQGTVLTYSETFFDPARTNDSCRSDNKLWEKDSIFVKAVQTNSVQADASVGNKVTATRTSYNDTYGLVIKVENLGEVTLPNPNDHQQVNNVPGDESYSFTDYFANNAKWIVKPKETWISDTPEGTTKYKQTYYYYDGNDRYWPAPIKGLEKGLLTRTSLEDAKTYGSIKRSISNFEYYDNGQPKKTIDPMGYTTETFYDNQLGVFPVAVKNHLGWVTRTEYWGKDYLLGIPTVTRDASGRTSKTEYDSFGRVLRTFNPSEADPTQPETEPSVKYEYFDNTGKPYIRISSRVFENNWQTVDQIYSGLGQLLQNQVLATNVDETGNGTKSEKGIVTETKYNSRGQAIEVGAPVVVEKREPSNPPVKLAASSAEKTTTVYDSLGRTVSVTDPLGRTSRSEYLNFTTTAIDPAGHRAVSEADGLGRVKTTAGYLGDFGQTSGKRINIATTYDVLGNPLQVVQTFPDNPDLGTITALSTYDLTGRKLSTSDPDLGKWTYEYDLKGRLTKQTDAKNQAITFEYDQLDRITKKNYPRKPYLTALRGSVEYKYDVQCGSQNALGLKCRMDDLTGYTSFEYDKKGRVVKMTKFIDRNITGKDSETANYEYTYYPTNQTKTYKYPDGELITYTYDKYGNQQTVNGAQQYLTDSAVNKFGSPTKITLGDGFSQTFAYDNISQLTNLTAKSGNQALFSGSYTSRDSLGNILSLTETNGSGNSETTSYTYDSMSQLKTAQVAGATNSNYAYQYDEAGNLKVKTEDSTVNMTYANTFPVHAPKTVDGFTYRYDVNGNLLEDKERTFEWDFDNKPLKIIMKSSGTQVLMFYDGDGERVTKKEDKTAIVYLPGVEKNLTTGETNKYYTVGGVTIQRNVNPSKAEKLYYLFPDHLSSTRAVVNKDTKETDNLSYYPFGNLKSISLPSEITNLYTNQKQDREVGLYYYNARYYNPTTGHFISADKAEGPNRYAYVGNNPVMKNDPSGNEGEGIYHWLFGGGYKDTYSLLQSNLGFGYKALGIMDEVSNHSISGLANAANLTFYPGAGVSQYGMERINAATQVGMVAVGTGEMVAGFAGVGFSANMMKTAMGSPVKSIRSPFNVEGIATREGGVIVDYDVTLSSKRSGVRSLSLNYDSAHPTIRDMMSNVRARMTRGNDPVAAVTAETEYRLNYATNRDAPFSLDLRHGGRYSVGDNFSGGVTPSCFDCAIFHSQALSELGVRNVEGPLGYFGVDGTIHAATRIGGAIFPYGSAEPWSLSGLLRAMSGSPQRMVSQFTIN